jgi:hypothetical protein
MRLHWSATYQRPDKVSSPTNEGVPRMATFETYYGAFRSRENGLTDPICVHGTLRVIVAARETT